MRDGSTPEEDRIRVWVDRGYQGTGRDLPDMLAVSPGASTAILEPMRNDFDAHACMVDIIGSLVVCVAVHSVVANVSHHYQRLQKNPLNVGLNSHHLVNSSCFGISNACVR